MTLTSTGDKLVHRREELKEFKSFSNIKQGLINREEEYKGLSRDRMEVSKIRMSTQQPAISRDRYWVSHQTMAYLRFISNKNTFWDPALRKVTT
jgi:hypothetical protein